MPDLGVTTDYVRGFICGSELSGLLHAQVATRRQVRTATGWLVGAGLLTLVLAVLSSPGWWLGLIAPACWAVLLHLAVRDRRDAADDLARFLADHPWIRVEADQ